MILNQINSINNWLSDEPNQRIGVRVLQTILGIVFVFRAFTEMPFAKYMYGAHGVGDELRLDLTFGEFIGGALNNLFRHDTNIYLLLIILAGCGLCFIVGSRTRIVTAISLITFNLISGLNLEVGDGGDNVTQLVLIYMLFLTPFDEAFKPGGLKVWVHNLAVVAIGLQVMILYFTAGFMKINGHVWTEGLALYNISQVETFSLPLFRSMFKNPYIATISAYITMIFLIWFPIAMFSKFKLLWILMGISFHLGIVGYMGLVTFGATMVGLELFFLTDKEYLYIKETSISIAKENPLRRLLARFKTGSVPSTIVSDEPSNLTT